MCTHLPGFQSDIGFCILTEFAQCVWVACCGCTSMKTNRCYGYLVLPAQIKYMVSQQWTLFCSVQQGFKHANPKRQTCMHDEGRHVTLLCSNIIFMHMHTYMVCHTKGGGLYCRLWLYCRWNLCTTRPLIVWTALPSAIVALHAAFMVHVFASLFVVALGQRSLHVLFVGGDCS